MIRFSLIVLTLIASALLTKDAAARDACRQPQAASMVTAQNTRLAESGEQVTIPTYVWTYHRCDVPRVVAMARSQGFVPTSAPIFRTYVPEAGGAAWVVYIRPCYVDEAAPRRSPAMPR